jgi:hypothetical protein
VKGSLVETVAPVRETNVKGKASHRGHRGHGGGIGLGAKGFWVTPWLPCEKRRLRGEHRTEVTEATEEKLGWGAEGLRWTRGCRARTRLRGNHRTEITEGEILGVESFSAPPDLCVDFPAERRFRAESQGVPLE